MRVENPTKIHLAWYFNPHPDLKGKIKGYKIRSWLTGIENVTDSTLHDSNGVNTFIAIKELDVNKNYTFVIHAITESATMGPGSEPVTNREEIGK